MVTFEYLSEEVCAATFDYQRKLIPQELHANQKPNYETHGILITINVAEIHLFLRYKSLPFTLTH